MINNIQTLGECKRADLVQKPVTMIPLAILREIRILHQMRWIDSGKADLCDSREEMWKIDFYPEQLNSPTRLRTGNRRFVTFLIQKKA